MLECVLLTANAALWRKERDENEDISIACEKAMCLTIVLLLLRRSGRDKRKWAKCARGCAE